MKKDINVIFQKKGSVDCGPVSTLMILNYFGIEIKLDEIKSDLTFAESGTYIFDNGLHFLKKNLKVEMVTANPLVFKKDEISKLKDSKDIVKHLSKVQKKKPKTKDALDIFKKFISEGGKVKLQIPSITHIQKALDKNKLVLALIYGGALGTNEGGFHFVIVSGYKKNYVFINNPLRQATQGWFKNEDFLYAIHSSTCADVDNGSLLIVGK